MKIKGILANKYTLPLLFLLALLITDVLLHKGMTRLMLPLSTFPETKETNLARCERPLLTTGKNWSQGINTIGKIKQLEKGVEGFEMDVYFDTSKNCLEVYHDSSRYSSLKITSILDIYKSRQLTASVWLDFKNLSASNVGPALHYISGLRKIYGLNNKLIIESSAVEWLQAFCDSGFFTSYYVPFFNPYLLSDFDLKVQLDTIHDILKLVANNHSI